MLVGHVAELRRFPVKSMAGERLTEAGVTDRGLEGDRTWATYTSDGGLGSGKTTKRFRRVDGLLDLSARLAGSAVPPLVTFPDGTERTAGKPETDEALTALLGQPLRLSEEGRVPHHDDAPVHLITTSALHIVGQELGELVDPARFRANLLIETPGTAFVEDAWHGRELAIGSEVVLVLDDAMPRCVMVGLPQPPEGLAQQRNLLTTLGRVHDVNFGLQARVLSPGTIRVGDVARLR